MKQLSIKKISDEIQVFLNFAIENTYVNEERQAHIFLALLKHNPDIKTLTQKIIDFAEIISQPIRRNQTALQQEAVAKCLIEKITSDDSAAVLEEKIDAPEKIKEEITLQVRAFMKDMILIETVNNKTDNLRIRFATTQQLDDYITDLLNTTSSRLEKLKDAIFKLTAPIAEVYVINYQNDKSSKNDVDRIQTFLEFISTIHLREQNSYTIEKEIFSKLNILLSQQKFLVRLIIDDNNDITSIAALSERVRLSTLKMGITYFKELQILADQNPSFRIEIKSLSEQYTQALKSLLQVSLLDRSVELNLNNKMNDLIYLTDQIQEKIKKVHHHSLCLDNSAKALFKVGRFSTPNPYQWETQLEENHTAYTSSKSSP